MYVHCTSTVQWLGVTFTYHPNSYVRFAPLDRYTCMILGCWGRYHCTCRDSGDIHPHLIYIYNNRTCNLCIHLSKYSMHHFFFLYSPFYYKKSLVKNILDFYWNHLCLFFFFRIFNVIKKSVKIKIFWFFFFKLKWSLWLSKVKNVQCIILWSTGTHIKVHYFYTQTSSPWCNLPVVQSGSVQPSLHWHRYEPSMFWQVPPFLHGFIVIHSFTSTVQQKKKKILLSPFQESYD